MANYYISSSTGDDSNDGLSSSTPKQTFSNFNNISILPGDNIYLKRGDTFRGWLGGGSGDSSSRVTIDAYGSGSNPILNGCIEITGWNNYSGNIYYASIPDQTEIKQLFIDGVKATQSRYPKSGYYTVDSWSSESVFSDSTLTEDSGYWVGATCCVRTSDYTWEWAKVSGFSGGIISLENQLYNIDTGNSNHDFFIRNSVNALTQAGEWVYVTAEQRVYLWMPDNSNPSASSIEGSYYDHGIGYWGLEYITINNIDFWGYSSSGVFCGGVNEISDYGNNTISNCDFDFCYATAIQSSGSAHTIQNNTISNIFGRGIELYLGSGEVVNNTFSNIGLEPGFGMSETSGMVGAWIEKGSNVTVRENTFTDIGYNAITCNTNGGVIEKNTITRACTHLSDGGAIYCFADYSHDFTIQNNFINSTGFLEGESGTYSWDIYLDNDSYNILVQNNVCKNSEAGGLLINANSHDNTVQNNIFLDFELTGIEIAEWEAQQLTRGNIVQNNILYTTSSSNAVIVLLRSFWGTEYMLGAFDYNYYGKSQNSDIIFAGSFNDTISPVTLTQWRLDDVSENINSTYLSNSTVTLFENKTNGISVQSLGSGFSDLDGNSVTQISIPAWDSVLLQGSGSYNDQDLKLIKTGSVFIKVGSKILAI